MREEMREEAREDIMTDKDLFQLTMAKTWHQVVDIYEKHPTAHTTKLTKSEETAFHIAISSYHSKSPNHDIFVEQMMDLMEKRDTLLDVLSMKNARGDTPLHLAAAIGSTPICQRIASKRREVIFIRNNNGETPLFVAAHHGNLPAFLCLHDLLDKIKAQENEIHDPLRRTKDGDTVLHSAISGEHFRLAYQIINYYPYLINSVNVNGESPLHVLARMPNVFISSIHLGFYESIIYRCVFVDELKLQKYDSRTNQDYPSPKLKYFPGNYRTCIDILLLLWNLILLITGGFGSCKRKSVYYDEENQHHREKEHTDTRKSLPTQEKSTKDFVESAENGRETVMDERRTSNQGSFFPANYITCIEIFKFIMKIILTILGVGFRKIRKIKVKKERCLHALEIMNRIIEHESSYKYDSNGQRPDKALKPELLAGIDIPNMPPEVDEQGSPQNTEMNTGTASSTQAQAQAQCRNENRKDEKTLEGLVKDTPLLVATKMGILVMVKKIISKCPIAIQDLDSNGRNAVMLAAEYRQTSVFDYLIGTNLPDYMFHQLDNEENSILHLAAKMGQFHPWQIPGAALQMQWEIKWYKHVKRSVSQLRSTHQNLKGETPRMMLTKTHIKLMKAGNEWLIKTSESCSVIATLIAAVAFATSATVPGGLDQDNGYPILKDNKAFDVFSLTSLVALCLSITALVFFLAIITSRCEERDFKRNLPRKLLMGLTCLFSSIAAMLVSFCAGHSFILRHKLRIAAVPIYAFATIPVAFFAIAQLPLYFDLLWADSRKVPLRSNKVLYQ